MLSMLNNWKGIVEVNGNTYNSIQQLVGSNFKFDDKIRIVLHPKTEKAENKTLSTSDKELNKEILYKIKVKPYMTKKATPQFDFMSRWNDNNPMPLRVMVGTKDKETKGMVHMTLHGDILEKETQFCMACGKPITNPVSRYFGVGPVCGGHMYVNPFESDGALKEAVESYRQVLRNKTWSGWVIKSAIEECEEINNE
jgi:hypothetical protein